jgi:hypothetical protein
MGGASRAARRQLPLERDAVAREREAARLLDDAERALPPLARARLDAERDDDERRGAERPDAREEPARAELDERAEPRPERERPELAPLDERPAAARRERDDVLPRPLDARAPERVLVRRLEPVPVRRRVLRRVRAPLRSSLGISSFATAPVSCGISFARNDDMRSSSRRMPFATFTVSRSPTVSASVMRAV